MIIRVWVFIPRSLLRTLPGMQSFEHYFFKLLHHLDVGIKLHLLHLAFDQVRQPTGALIVLGIEPEME